MGSFKFGGRILIGNNQIKDLLSQKNNAFIVCDPFIEKSGIIGYITDLIKDYRIFSDISPDPDIELVTKGTAILSEYKPNVVIAIGGGSAIDAAKAMLYFARKEMGIINIPFYAIPTTSGTGSEVTDFSVITNHEKGLKYPLIDESLLPDYALLDANLTLSVPPKITAATGIDVLTHSIEAIVSVRATDFSDALAEKAIRLVWKYLIIVYKNPSDLEARQGMHNAACLAGIAFNNAGLGLNHGMAHALGGKFGIPHGEANGILLPYVIGFNSGYFDNTNENGEKYEKISRLLGVKSINIKNTTFNLIRIIKSTNDILKIPRTIKAYGIKEKEFMAEIDNMSKAAFKDRCTVDNPRKCDISQIRDIYIKAYHGYNHSKNIT